MKKMTIKFLTVTLLAGLMTLSTASAQIVYTWTNGGVANDLDDPNNWDQATAPASGSKLGNVTAGDTIRFNSETATLPTANIDLVRIGAGNAMSNLELLNGSLNFNRAEVYHLGGTTFTIGDGDLTTLAQANFTNGTINLNRDGGAITYLINADGTLKLNNNFIFGQNNSVIRLLGGAVDGTGRNVTNNFATTGSNYVAFESLSSTFTLNYGGELANAAAVTGEFGDSFRFGGALISDPTAQLSIISDNGTTFTVGVIPEPTSFALLGLGLGALFLARRRK